ncbi:MAG: hypothetical protein ACRC4N_04705 [Gammaproteobacteria bacterium]
MSFVQHNQILLNLWQNVENPVMFDDRIPIETQHFEQQVTQTAQNHTALVGPDGKPHTLAPSCLKMYNCFSRDEIN